MAQPGRKLASSTEFTVGIVGSLRDALTLVSSSAPGRESVIETVRANLFSNAASDYSDPTARLEQQSKRARNVLIGMHEYGLVDESYGLTTRGSVLLSIDESRAEARFAEHILQNLHGLEVLQAIRDMQSQGLKVGKESLAEHLRAVNGFQLPRDTTKHLGMLNWLRPAGVFKNKGYEIDIDRVSQIIGVDLVAVDDWSSLSGPEREFLAALKRLSVIEGPGPYTVKKVLDQAELEHGPLQIGGQTRKLITAPLERAGWISLSGSSGGRGAKSGSVTASNRLLEFDVEKALGFTLSPLPPDLARHMNKPLEEVQRDLGSSDTFVAGIALEVLALKMTSALGLVPVELRKRDDKTGGGEVDVLAEAVHLHFSRWLFQCKNQKTPVSVHTLTKEIGNAVVLQANVVVLATTGRFTAPVRELAQRLAQMHTLQVVLVDGSVIRAFLKSGDAKLQEHFHRAAVETKAVKEIQIRST